MIFLDASALAKMYLEEEGSAVVNAVLRLRRDLCFLSEFVALEVLTAIRTTLRPAAADAFRATVARFRSHYPALYNLVEVTPEVRARAMSLTTQHRDARARAMDILHLATALHLQAGLRDGTVTMLTSDRDLAALTRRCGLRTFDPSREPLSALPRARR